MVCSVFDYDATYHVSPFSEQHLILEYVSHSGKYTYCILNFHLEYDGHMKMTRSSILSFDQLFESMKTYSCKFLTYLLLCPVVIVAREL